MLLVMRQENSVTLTVSSNGRATFTEINIGQYSRYSTASAGGEKQFEPHQRVSIRACLTTNVQLKF
jgi:hypothetical protein